MNYLIVPPCILQVRPKPKFYWLYSKKKRLWWLKTKRRLFIEKLFNGTIEVVPTNMVNSPDRP